MREHRRRVGHLAAVRSTMSATGPPPSAPWCSAPPETKISACPASDASAPATKARAWRVGEMSQSSSMVWRWPRNLPSLLASALASRATRRWSAERDRTVIDDATGPRAHHADVVGEISGLAQVVGDEQYGRPAYEPQLLEDRPQLLARELVECAKRFVEQQKLRIVDQRAAE